MVSSGMVARYAYENRADVLNLPIDRTLQTSYPSATVWPQGKIPYYFDENLT